MITNSSSTSSVFIFIIRQTTTILTPLILKKWFPFVNVRTRVDGYQQYLSNINHYRTYRISGNPCLLKAWVRLFTEWFRWKVQHVCLVPELGIITVWTSCWIMEGQLQVAVQTCLPNNFPLNTDCWARAREVINCWLLFTQDWCIWDPSCRHVTCIFDVLPVFYLPVLIHCTAMINVLVSLSVREGRGETAPLSPIQKRCSNWHCQSGKTVEIS